MFKTPLGSGLRFSGLPGQQFSLDLGAQQDMRTTNASPALS